MSRRTDRGDPDAQQSVAVGVPSKEELQSINEELQTVNAELNVRVDELRRANSDIANLLAHQQVLLHELQHRVKNILATISALATRMLRDAPSVDGFSNAFLGRLRAMAATHELLSQANWTGADLRQLLETTLRGQNPSAGAIHIDGPAVLLTPAAASTLGMVVYEMATNAAKYGALSSARGRIEIGWTVVRDAAGDRLGLCWTELAGPPVPTAIADGFGVAFIKGGVEYELQGSAIAEPRPAGLRWALEFPLKGNVKDV
jgi:two-component system CheB/CheR fusion protein